MAYNELVKNFKRIRDYMREFYVYGFKSRDEFNKKSARSYDDERRRLESWLGDYMQFRQTAEGKNMFLSIDSRLTKHNPLFKAWKTKSFTDGDITLHFIIMDILSEPGISMALGEITDVIDEYLSKFSNPRMFDESTVRKKLKKYVSLGILTSKKQGKTVYYQRAESVDLPDKSMLDYFSEVLPLSLIHIFAVVIQANSVNQPYFRTLASSDMLINFYGKQAHASMNPWEGVSALNGVQLFFHGLDMLRVGLEKGDDVQGVILDGGKIPNVIPEKATAYVYLRSKTINRLMKLKKKVEQCAKGCAMAVDNKYDYSQNNPDYAEVFIGNTEKKIVCDIMDELNLNWEIADEPRGSSDVGNLDTIIPVFNPVIATEVSETKLYSKEFAELMKTEKGTHVMVTGAKVMARIIEKMAFEKGLLEKVKEEHREYRNNVLEWFLKNRLISNNWYLKTYKNLCKKKL